jgi:hypothetical protein
MRIRVSIIRVVKFWLFDEKIICFSWRTAERISRRVFVEKGR